MAEDELMDVVDRNDNVIGQSLRSEIYTMKSPGFRVINAFIVNGEGKLCLPRRADTKKLFPLCLDTSVGGHVKSGETYEAALFREAKEETHLDLNLVSWRNLGYLTPWTHGTSAFMKVYEIWVDTAPRFNPDDFVAFYWLYPHEVMRRLATGDRAKDDLPIIISVFYGVNI